MKYRYSVFEGHESWPVFVWPRVFIWPRVFL
jgi:hypothetical protein